MISRHMKIRFSMCILLFMSVIIGLGSRLVFLHLGPNEAFCRRVEQRRSFEKEIRVRRGNICDRNGLHNLLALDIAVKDVCASPVDVLKSNAVLQVASSLAKHLDIPVDEIAVKLNSPDRLYSRIKRFVPTDLADKIEQEHLAGVFLRDANVRYYPQDSFMCHVLGFVNYQGIGSAGIEQFKQSDLKGTPGVIEGQLDARRHEVCAERERNNPGVEGSDVQLTLDQNVQHIVEKALDDVMEKYAAKGAWCIVQRVKTGEILAMASRPAYNLNEFGSASDDVKLNRAISYVYEPGSTMKAVCYAAVLNEGVVTPETVLSCEGGAWYYKGKVLHDCHDYGNLTVEDGLKKSSNILTAKLSLKLGNEKLYNYMRAFGIGKKLGIDLPGEECGILHNVDKWYGISPTRIPIGQGVAVTALQMLGVYCTIANHGYLMRPYVVQRVISTKGKVKYEAKPQVIAKVIRADTAATMCRMLGRVTEVGGTGTRACFDGFKVAGKTGTAQKPIRGGYSKTAFVSSFVGFFPVEKPELGIIVVVDHPTKKSHYGGVVAAPAFSTIGKNVARYLEIQPGVTSVSGRLAER